MTPASTAIRAAFPLALLVVFAGWDWLSAPDPEVAAGNVAYASGEYGSALALYERSSASEGDSAALRFDVGAALYKLAQREDDLDRKAQFLERAESAFREATDTGDPTLESAAYHNIGNAMFVRKRWKQAAEAYKKALRANQDNDDARYNLELVLRRKEKQEKKQGPGKSKQQPQNPGQGQQPKKQGNDGGSKDAQDPSATAKDPQSPGGPGQQNQDQAGSPGGPQGKANGAPQQDSSSAAATPPGAPRPGQPGSGTPPPIPDRRSDNQRLGNSGSERGQPESMSDRNRKLDALENRSRNLRRRRLRRPGSSGPRTRYSNPKDW